MRTIIILTILMSTTLVAPIVAQQQATQDLPTYTTEQRWERASRLLTVTWAVGIAHAKSIGQSVEEYGEFLAKLASPGWGEPGSGSLEIIRGIRIFLLSHPCP